MLRSLSSFLLPEPRVTAPVSSTTAARPRSFRQDRVCWSQAQSPLPVVTPPARAEAVEGVVLKDVLVEVLVPHGIGDHDVVAGDAAHGVLELGVDHGVAALYLDLHVVDDGVHVGDGVAVGLQLLAAFSFSGTRLVGSVSRAMSWSLMSSPAEPQA